jgi:endonuclease/exonuclease/phosphatase family metal-dependent hydrolase
MAVRIRVATLNVWGLPEPIAPDVSARMDAIAEELAALRVDVVAFQEVWTSEARTALVAAGRGAGLVHSWHLSDLVGGGGLLFLSRLPIGDVHFEHFDLRGQVEEIRNLEFLSGKGFVRISVETPEGPIRLINTHLHARYSSRVSHAFVSHRVGQIVQLAARTSRKGGPVVILGDFNFTEDDAEYRVLTGLMGLRDAAVELDRRLPTVLANSPYRPGRRRDSRKDFIFVRDGEHLGVAVRALDQAFQRPFLVDGRPAACSNHAGVVADLEFGAHAAVAAKPRREVFAIASQLLDRGRASAERRQTSRRTFSGVGAGISLAAVTAAAIPSERVSRRRFLRGCLRGAALLVVTPSLAFSILSEVVVPDEIHAFRVAAKDLASLMPRDGDLLPS